MDSARELAKLGLGKLGRARRSLEELATAFAATPTSCETANRVAEECPLSSSSLCDDNGPVSAATEDNERSQGQPLARCWPLPVDAPPRPLSPVLLLLPPATPPPRPEVDEELLFAPALPAPDCDEELLLLLLLLSSAADVSESARL